MGRTTYAVFAAPKMPNLRASSFLVTKGGLNAVQIRYSRAAIPVFCVAGRHGKFAGAITKVMGEVYDTK